MEADTISEREASPERARSRATTKESAIIPVTPPRHEASDGIVLTPVRSNSGMKTPARTTSLDEVPFLATPMPRMSETDLAEKAEEKVLKTCPKWSEVLKTPSTNEKFSPSKELNKPKSLHGLGLMVATDRAKKLSQSGSRCATLLFDIATLQESFAQSLLKAHPQTTSSTPVSKTLITVNGSRVSFAKQLQGLAICVRGSVARPLHETMASLGDTAPSIYHRYAATRVSCATARLTALAVRNNYVKAVREAEAAIREMRKAKQNEGPRPEIVTSDSQESETSTKSQSTESPWETSLRMYGRKYGVSPDRLIALLNEVQSLEAEYKKLVKDENDAVSQAQTMEIMALEAAQKLEEERLQFFVESMNRMLTAERGALDNMALSAEKESAPPEVLPAGSSPQVKKPNDFFKNILKTNSHDHEPGIGSMGASTLGLPEDVGSLRDEVRSCLSTRVSRIQVARALAANLEEIAAAASAFASGLENRMGQEGYSDIVRPRNPDPLIAVMKRSEGPHVGKYWDSIMTNIGENAGLARQLAQDLRLLCQEKLDTFVLRAEKDCKTASESDDHRWKHLCDTARNETKAQMRYQQANSQFEKARERVRSVDSEMGNSEHGEGKAKLNAGMSKALGNVFSILPDGGEQAMQKMLNPDARRAIAKTNLQEADQKESKEKNALDAAVVAKGQALKSYKATAENLVYTFKNEDEAGWTDMESMIKSILSSFERFRSHRYGSLDRSSTAAAGPDAQTSDIAEWTARARIHIAKKAEKEDDSPDPNKIDRGFALKVELEDSVTMYKLLTLTEVDGDEPDLGNGSTESDSSTSTGQASDLKEDDLLNSAVARVHSPTTTICTSEKEELSISSRSPPRTPPRKAESLGHSSDAAETELFLAHFWSDREDGAEPPTVIESFSCAYWPKEGEGHLSPLLHGRLFLTSKAMYFVGWGDKKIVLNLDDIVSVSKEKNMMGTIDNSLCVQYESEAVESSYFFGSFAFRDKAFLLLQQLSMVARSLRELNGSPKSANSALPDVPPDEVMKKMDVVLSKKIKNVSIQRFYELIWSEGQGGVDEKPFYGPCLVDMGSHKVSVGEWEFAKDEADCFTNQWCGEKYSQRRVVTFEFTRKTHLYVGPPTAGVKQTHHCLVKGNDVCILAITAEMNGIPYADCFAVEVRWFARRSGSQDIHVDIGVVVDFKKSTMFASKIRAGTITETTPVHHAVFERAKAVCLEAGGEGLSGIEAEEDKEEEELVLEVEKPKNKFLATLENWKDTFINDVSSDTKIRLLAGLVGFFLLRFITSLVRRRARSATSQHNVADLGQRIDDLHEEIREIRNTLDAILKVMNEGNHA